MKLVLPDRTAPQKKRGKTYPTFQDRSSGDEDGGGRRAADRFIPAGSVLTCDSVHLITIPEKRCQTLTQLSELIPPLRRYGQDECN